MSVDRLSNQYINLPKYEIENLDNKILPSYLHLENGHFRFDQAQVIEGGTGEYDTVWDFGNSRNDLRQEVPRAERIRVNVRSDIRFLGFADPAIKYRMDAITRIANDPQKSFENPDDRVEYRSHLGEVYESLARVVRHKLLGGKALFFAPKNGGIFVRDVFTKEGIPNEDFYDYRMSRVLVADNHGEPHMNVAAKFGPTNPNITDYRNFVFSDDCLASDTSCFATLDFIATQLRRKNIDPFGTRVIISVSAASQRGLESLLSKEVRNKFDFRSMEVVAAVPVYKMTDEFYLQELDGRYKVGDMGKWTIRP